MGLLDGYRIIDMSTLFAGPSAATLLADNGAEVIKIEHPRGDDLRRWGASEDGVSLWWKIYSRNKRIISVDLNSEDGRKIVKKLVAESDVLIENFRPGRMEKWGLSYEELKEVNKRLIMMRVTGFGQKGPYSGFAGFGTLAEAMSGFANLNGYPEGPPTLPPMALADGVAGVLGAFSITAALLRREKTGKGELIDISLYEPLMWILGAQISEFDRLGVLRRRTGNQSDIASPRNIYPTSDGRWVAISASAQSIAERLFRTIGRSELIDDSRYATNGERLKHRNELDEIVSSWTGKLSQDEIVHELREAGVAVAPIYDAQQILQDEHFRQRESVVSVKGEDGEPISMQGVIPRLKNENGEIKWTGKGQVGADTDEVLKSIGYSAEEISKLKSRKVV